MRELAPTRPPWMLQPLLCLLGFAQLSSTQQLVTRITEWSLVPRVAFKFHHSYYYRQSSAVRLCYGSCVER